MSDQYIDIPAAGSAAWKSPVANAAALPATGNQIGDARVAKDTQTIYIWSGSAWVPVSSGGGGVTSFNTRTGAITLTATDVTDALGIFPANDTLSNLATPSINASLLPDTDGFYNLGQSGLNWNNVSANTLGFDGATQLDLVNSKVFDGAALSLNWLSRGLYATDGTTLTLDWSSASGPTTITQSPGNNTTKVATTAFVASSLSNYLTGSGTASRVPFYSAATTLSNTANLAWSSTFGQLQVGPTTLGINNLNNVISIGGTINNYMGPYIQNSSTGTSASSDLLIGNNADAYTGNGNYVNLGINSSTHTTSGNLGANDVYLQSYGTTHKMVIGTGTAGATNNLLFITGGTATTNVRATIDGNGVFSITPGALGTSVATSALSISQTWNTTGAPTAIKLNITNTASGAASLLLDLQASAVSQFSVSKAGKIALSATNTAAGTTGAQTINKPSGTVNFAAAATSLVVTNSLVTTASIVMCVVRTADSTATIKNVVPGAGSFTINLGAAATAETSVGFVVYN
jgi:hypothetical protein